jgi:hypothetical protein
MYILKINYNYQWRIFIQLFLCMSENIFLCFLYLSIRINCLNFLCITAQHLNIYIITFKGRKIEILLKIDEDKSVFFKLFLLIYCGFCLFFCS